MKQKLFCILMLSVVGISAMEEKIKEKSMVFYLPDANPYNSVVHSAQIGETFAKQITYLDEYSHNTPANVNEFSKTNLHMHWDIFTNKYPQLKEYKSYSQVVNHQNIQYLVAAYNKDKKLPLSGGINFLIKRAENLHLLILFIGKLTPDQRKMSAHQLWGCALDLFLPWSWSPSVDVAKQILEELEDQE